MAKAAPSRDLDKLAELALSHATQWCSSTPQAPLDRDLFPSIFAKEQKLIAKLLAKGGQSLALEYIESAPIDEDLAKANFYKSDIETVLLTDADVRSALQKLFVASWAAGRSHSPQKMAGCVVLVLSNALEICGVSNRTIPMPRTEVLRTCTSSTNHVKGLINDLSFIRPHLGQLRGLLASEKVLVARGGNSKFSATSGVVTAADLDALVPLLTQLTKGLATCRDLLEQSIQKDKQTGGKYAKLYDFFDQTYYAAKVHFGKKGASDTDGAIFRLILALTSVLEPNTEIDLDAIRKRFH